MKTGASSLNANAASYIPLCNRAATGENKDYLLVLTKVPESRNGDHQNPTSEVYSWEDTGSHGSYASSSKSPKKVSEKDLLDEDFDMDLAYLQMTFPGFSEESLSHIYLANRGDLENTVDMLNQLELCTGDSPELPEEIGDTSENQSDSSKESASLKLEEVADEVNVLSGSINQQPQPN